MMKKSLFAGQESQAEMRYQDAGVSIDAGNDFVEKIKPIVKQTHRLGSHSNIGGFGGIFDLKPLGYKDPLLVAANDGVGTKLKIAIESGCHNTIGIDLVAMCVNDLIVQGAEPLFFLDYFATGKLDVTQGVEIVASIAKGCAQAGCALIGGETAEMPGLYSGKDYDLAGFSVGVVERERLLPAKTLSAGDILLGLPSSGLHSNGFSLVRKIVERSKLHWEDPAPFAPEKTLASALLVPTRIYVKPVLSALKRFSAIKALAHITGGGFTENIPRILSKNLAVDFDLSNIAVPSVFSWISSQGNVRVSEMLRTFNCGIGMVLIVDQHEADAVLKYFQELGENPVFLGSLKDDTENTISYNGRLSL